jgi:hypothetical protein
MECRNQPTVEKRGFIYLFIIFPVTFFKSFILDSAIMQFGSAQWIDNADRLCWAPASDCQTRINNILASITSSHLVYIPFSAN